MLINPTKKAQSLFSELSSVTDQDIAVAFAETNPFFSWHAHYFLINRKKILFLVNDLTCSSIIIADVNAKNRKQLPDFIREGIRFIFELSDIPTKQIDTYLQLSEPIEIHAAHNRSRISLLNRFISEILPYEIDLSTHLQKELMVSFAENSVSTLEDYVSLNAVKKAFNHPLYLKEVKKPLEKKTIPVIQKNWQNFAHWEKYASHEGWFEDYEKVAEEIQENNQIVLADFANYLENNLNLSSKTIRKHLTNMDFFLNIFLLYYGIHTPLTDFSDTEEFIGDFFTRKALWASESQVKQLGSSMKKFYTFLEKTEDITKKQLVDVKKQINEGVFLGLMNVEFY